ncbi:MAG: thioredoxin family protein [Ignavibacteriales bacterium]
MAAVESMMLALGTRAPDFSLPDTVKGDIVSLADIRSGVATVIMFICNHCPYVKHIQQELVRLAKDYMAKGVSFAAISSNDIIGYPEDSPERMKELALHLGFPFPYLYDESQDVARSYKAVCTPDFFVFDRDLMLAYRGQMDSSRPGNSIPVDAKDIRAALDSIIEGKPVSQKQIPSIGCSIKWKK